MVPPHRVAPLLGPEQNRSVPPRTQGGTRGTVRYPVGVSSPAERTALMMPWHARREPRYLYALATANVIAQIGIILTGGFVRLTGSGLGCSTWPQCEPGTFTPQVHEAASYHPFVEFGNRTLTGVLALIGVALLVAVLRSPATRARGAGLKWLAAAPLLGIAAQAAIGGVTVLLDLHPAVVGVHYIVSAVLVWLSALLLFRLREDDSAPLRTMTAHGPSEAWLRAVPAVMGFATALIVVLGVITTGSGPHSGDDEIGYRFALDPALMARLHAGAVWLFAIVLLLTLWVVARTGAPVGSGPARLSAIRYVRRRWWRLFAVTIAQGLVGYIQYFSGLPVLLVALHMLLSGWIVANVTFAVLSLRIRWTPYATELAGGSARSDRHEWITNGAS